MENVPAASIHKIVEAGIPVVGHIGLTPQSVHQLGGFRVQGRGGAAAEQLRNDALTVQQAGAFALVLEMVPQELAAEVTEAIDIPTIGIGAGPQCDGQVLVCNDPLGLDMRFNPRFLKRYANLEESVVHAIETYVEEVRAGLFPTKAHSFQGQGRGKAKVTRFMTAGLSQSMKILTDPRESKSRPCDVAAEHALVLYRQWVLHPGHTSLFDLARQMRLARSQYLRQPTSDLDRTRT